MKQGFILGALLAVVLAGCGSAPKASLYTLSSVSPQAPTPGAAAEANVSVGPVTLPEAVDRPELLLSVAPGRAEAQELHRWSAPLKAEIGRVVAENLAKGLGSARVRPQQSAAGDTDYQVVIDVQRFELGPHWIATLDAQWTVRRIAGSESKTGRAVLRSSRGGEGYEGVVRSLDLVLLTLSQQVAEAILELEKQRRP